MACWLAAMKVSKALRACSMLDFTTWRIGSGISPTFGISCMTYLLFRGSNSLNMSRSGAGAEAPPTMPPRPIGARAMKAPRGLH
ncbi:MAG: hypothetical protein ACOC8P_02755, partial [Dichotomicrobium sp.]